MSDSKWNSSGVPTFADGDSLPAAELNDTLSVSSPPIGAIVAWAKSFTGVPGTLPIGWVECDGSVISDTESPLDGETLPDLNGSVGTQRFLRGSTTSGSTGGSETHTHGISDNNAFEEPSGSFDTGSTVTDATSTLPSYYEVVWIMRIK